LDGQATPICAATVRSDPWTDPRITRRWRQAFGHSTDVAGAFQSEGSVKIPDHTLGPVCTRGVCPSKSRPKGGGIIKAAGAIGESTKPRNVMG